MEDCALCGWIHACSAPSNVKAARRALPGQSLCGHYSAMAILHTDGAIAGAPLAPAAGLCWVNHAAIAPWPACTSEAMKQFAGENSAFGPENYKAWIRRENDLRRALASMVNAASTSDIALLKNTTEGISTVAFGLDLQAGDNIVIPKDEFASNRLPWLAQQQRGVEVRQVDIRLAEDAEASLIAAMDEGTRLLAVSAVQWTDGFRLDLHRLGQHCRQQGVLFFVDAIQQLGALQVDVSSACIDFLAADAHKWLLGPEGIALFYSTAAARERLKLLQVGWHMLETHWSFADTTTATRTARRFEAGSPNSMGQAALLASLGFLMETGMPGVEARVLANTAHLIDGLGQIEGVTITSRQELHRRSGIVSFVAAQHRASALFDSLQSAGIRCSLRNGAIRLSPHFYQGPAVMDYVLACIEQAVTGHTK
jgi:cysteine desulfurase/selenocysteine lyase